MKIPANIPRLKGFRSPREVIADAMWAYHRFAVSTVDVEGPLAIVSREAIRLWVNCFDRHFRRLYQTRSPRIKRQMASGRKSCCVAIPLEGGGLHPQCEILALAGDQRGRKCP